MSPTAVRSLLLAGAAGLALLCSTGAAGAVGAGTALASATDLRTAAPYQGNAIVAADPTSLTVNQDGFAGDTVTFDVVVPVPVGASCAGSVRFYDGLNTLIAGPVTVGPGTPCEAHATSTFISAGSHSITAVFTPPAGSTGLIAATSPEVYFSQDAQGTQPCGDAGTAGNGACCDVQTIQGTIPEGMLTISTPYTATTPLDLGTLTLDPGGTYFTGTAPFGTTSGGTASEIFVTDTRAGDLAWTAEAQASALSDGGSNPGSTINGEDLGLTTLTVVPVAGNGFNTSAQNFTTIANPPAAPPVGPTDGGMLGLGNVRHDFAQAQEGFGSVGLTGTLTLNAPSSTEAGLFKGTITFTIVGSIA